MRYKSPGRMKTVKQFRVVLRAIDPGLECDAELLGAAGPLGQPLRFGDRTIGNRFATQPMEGWDGTPAGRPSEHTLRRWRRFGESGAKLIWGGEAFAVREDGRANPRQLFLNPRADCEGGLAALLQTVRTAHREVAGTTEDLLVGLQLTHSGRFARPSESGPSPKIAYHHPFLERKYTAAAAATPLTDSELEAIGESFVEAARLAQRVGFDFVDVKCCHGYLLHELLSARLRDGKYGGSFENRTRLFVRIVEGIRVACRGLTIATRVSITDVFPFSKDAQTGVGVPLGIEEHTPYEYGFGIDRNNPLRPDFNEPFRFLELVQRLGIHLVNITIGSPYSCPHIQRPAAYAPSDGYLPPEDPLNGVARHLKAVRACKQAFPDLALVGSAYSYLQEYLPHVAQHEVGRGHVDFVGLGRMVLSYPELPRDVLRGRPLDRKRICRTFSDCTTGPRHGMISGCYPLDDYYGSRPEAKRIALLRRGRTRSDT